MDQMVQRGFRQADLDEGFELLRRVVPASVPEPRIQNDVLEEKPMDLLTRWQDAWFPMAALALRRRAPDLAKVLLDDLMPNAILAVHAFLDRLDKLDDGKVSRRKNDKGPGVQARELMAERGLSADVLRQGRQLLAKARAGQPIASTPREDEASFAKADEELWAYYLQWSQVVRLVIKEKSLLRQFGFRPAGRPRKKDSPAVAAEPPPAERPSPTGREG